MKIVIVHSFTMVLWEGRNGWIWDIMHDFVCAKQSMTALKRCGRAKKCPQNRRVMYFSMKFVIKGLHYFIVNHKNPSS